MVITVRNGIVIDKTSGVQYTYVKYFTAKYFKMYLPSVRPTNLQHPSETQYVSDDFFINSEPMVSERQHAELPIQEVVFPAPELGESETAHTISRAVGYYRRAVVAGEIALCVNGADTMDALARTEEAAWERTDRLVFAAIRSAAPPTSERIKFLSRYYLHGADGSCDSAEDQPYCFAFDGNGKVRMASEEAGERKEAWDHAVTIEESHRFAEVYEFDEDELQVVRNALLYMLLKANNDVDRREVKLAGRSVGLCEFDAVAADRLYNDKYARITRGRNRTAWSRKLAAQTADNAGRVRLVKVISKHPGRYKSVPGGIDSNGCAPPRQGTHYRFRQQVLVSHSS